MNSTPASGRVHIGSSRRRNAGKSSVLNAITGQGLAVVSSVKETITDSVYKAMELLPLGPAMMIGAPEIDDKGELGSLRARKSYQALNKTDVAVLAADHCHDMTLEDSSLLKRIKEKQIPYVIVCNKMDLEQEDPGQADWEQNLPLVKVSASTDQGIVDLKECPAALGKIQGDSRRTVGGLLEPQDFVVLIVSIDKAAPEGRLILPQQQTICGTLEAGAAATVPEEDEPAGVLPALGRRPKIVITDGQVFARVSTNTPEDILLTSFSIPFTRYKRDLEQLVKGMTALDHIGKGDRILVSKGCTHHRQRGGIGMAKFPSWTQDFMGTGPEFVSTSGTEFPDDLGGYRLVTRYGERMLNEREMRYRMRCARDQRVPMTSYRITIAYMHGILRCSLEPSPHVATLLGRKGT